MKSINHITDPETAKLIESLQLHQIELERQNEELRFAKEKADLATQKYAELYDFAPSGYFTLSRDGVIVELNLCGSLMIGVERQSLGNRNFGSFLSADTLPEFSFFLKNVFQSKQKETCEVTLIVENSKPIYVRLSSIVTGNGEFCLLTAIDITDRKISEDKLKGSQLLMRSSLESQKGMILLSVDRNYCYLYFNSAHRNLMKSAYGLEIEIGMCILDCITSEIQRALTKKEFDRSMDGISHSKVWKFGGSDTTFYESFFNPVLNDNHEVVGVTAFTLDISARKRSEELLRESKSRLDRTQQIAHLGSWDLDLASRELFWSDEVYRIFGHSPQSFVPTYKSFIEAVYPDDRTNVDLSYSNSVRDNKPGYELEHRIIRPGSGETRYVFEKCEHIRNTSGEIIGSVGMVQDITERKRAEIALVESEEKFRNFIQFSSDPIFSFNKDDSYRYVNEAFARPFGKKTEEIIGKTQHDIFPEDEAEKRLAVVHHVFKTGQKVEIEAKVLNASGETQYFLTSADPLIGENGEVLYVNCVSKEITQLKKVEQALKESEAQMAALLAAIPDMIFILDREGVYLDYRGPVTAELYTMPLNFIGKNIKDVLPPDLSRQFDLAFQAAISTGQVQLCKYSIELSNGLNYFEGKVVAYAESKLLTITRNISGYKHAEELINRKNEDLFKLNVEKDKFFSIIAHDLRGPFSGFLGLTETLAKRLPDMTLKEIQEITFLMRNSAIHLFRLLGNLLEWSRMQRGLTAFEPKLFLVRQKIEDYWVLANQMAAEKEITIKIELPDDLMVFADENMFESILRNLVSNAIKYTSRNGNIFLKIKGLSDHSVEISVQDTGIGMDEKLISQLYRIDMKSGRKGTAGELSSGLGLIICKDFIEKHRGKLEVTSKVGVGTTFRCTLPPQ